MNKLFLYAVLLTITYHFSSCELVELKEPPVQEVANDITEENEEKEDEKGGGEMEPTDGMDEMMEEENIPTDKEVFLQKLHNGSARLWRAVSFTLQGLNGFQDCRLDDTMEINQDGTYTYNGGDRLCGGEDNVTRRNGRWEVSEDLKTLTFDKGTSREFSSRVIALEDTRIRLGGSYMGLSIVGTYR